MSEKTKHPKANKYKDKLSKLLEEKSRPPVKKNYHL